MKELIIGLCKGRHQINGVEEYIFPNEVNPLDLNGMNIQIHEALKDADAVRLYVTGLTVAEKVISEQNTLSPGFIPASLTAKCNVEVPEDNATAY